MKTFRTLLALLAVALACLGAYYAIVSVQVLVNLSDVTNRWIQLSGDSDFRWDFEPFKAMIGSGAAAVLVFGIGTVMCGIRAASGRLVRARYWVALAMAAPLVHFPWFVYKLIATGRRPGWDLTARSVAIRLVVICVAYAITCALVRHEARSA